MRTRLGLIGCLALTVALASTPAYAGRVDLAVPPGTETALFGSLQTSFSDTTTVCAGCATGDWTITVDARTYFTPTAIGLTAGAGVFTYVYDISHTLEPGPFQDTLDILTVQSGNFPSTLVLNAPLSGFNYGVVDAAADFGKLVVATSGTNLSFIFAAFTSSGLFDPDGLSLVVYAQDDQAPGLVPYFGQDTGQASGADTLAPVPVPEPATLTLLALGLIGVAAFTRRRPL